MQSMVWIFDLIQQRQEMVFCLATRRSGAVLLVIAIFFLIGCGSQSSTTVHGKSFEYWLEALHDPDLRIRIKAVESLGNVGVENPATVPALIKTLDDREARVRGAAVLALLKIGPDAQEAIPALQRALNDKDPKVRAHANKALERIGNAS